MATRKTRSKEIVEDRSHGLPKIGEEVTSEFQAAYDEQQIHHERWNEQERMLISEVGSNAAAMFNSTVTDSRLSTLAFEGAARVVAQLATGLVRALTKKNRGLGQIMNLWLTKYVQPNDNFQFDHLTKMRMVNTYSRCYGVMPVLYDIAVTEHYLGPASYILPIRSWYPQPGKISVDDSDYNFIETWVSASWLEAQIGKGSWNEKVIRYVLSELKDRGGASKTNRPSTTKSVVENKREQNVPGGKGPASQIRMITRYGQGSKGRWQTWLPDFDNVMARDCNSKDGHIPIVLKHFIPLLDSIYGLGMFERGKTIQYAMDSLVAMYLSGVQMSIFPPRIITDEGVIRESLDYAPGATWIETVKDSIRNYTVSPDGLTTFQSTYGWLTGALLNQNGASDTRQTKESSSDPNAGRTPQALKMQEARESAADAWDRSMQEKFQEKLYERMINIAHLTPKPFSFHIFDAEIKEIQAAGMDDVANVVDIFDTGKEGKVTLDQNRLKNVEFRFIIDAGSSMQQDMITEHGTWDELLNKFVQAPQLLPAATAYGVEINLGEILKQFVITGGAKDWEKVITDRKQQQTLNGGVEAASGMPQPGMGKQLPDASAMMQLLSGKDAPQPEAPDETKDPAHEFIKTHFPNLPIAAQRKIVASIVGPDAAQGMFPAEAEMINKLSSPSQFDEQGIDDDRADIQIDPNSPYGAAVDPHEHLKGVKDPAVSALYQHIMSTGKPGVPIEPTEPVPAGG